MDTPCKLARHTSPTEGVGRVGRTDVWPSSKAYISFGGLLMSLEGPYKKLTPLRVDYTYLLVKK